MVTSNNACCRFIVPAPRRSHRHQGAQGFPGELGAAAEEAELHDDGNANDLRTGTNPAPSSLAAGAARMNPRASIPTTLSTGPCPLARPVTTARSAPPSASSGV